MKNELRDLILTFAMATGQSYTEARKKVRHAIFGDKNVLKAYGISDMKIKDGLKLFNAES